MPTPAEHDLRPLGRTDRVVTSVAMGCWPIAGMTSLDVDTRSSLATLEAAFDAGIRHFDTAFCYGAAGESETLIGRALRTRRDRITIATKGGIHWNASGERVIDGRPATLKSQCDTSLRRLGTDRVDLLYLHAPDPTIEIEQSADALYRLLRAGKTAAIGLSNVDVEQAHRFAAVCPVAAIQPHYNLLQREIEQDLVPFCLERRISLMTYWPLMKGLLAGHLRRDHVFAPGDGRAKYPMFRGEEWERNQDFVDRIRAVATDAGRSVTATVINWTIHRPGITSALCGAKRPEQIRESAEAMGWRLTDDQLAAIDRAIAERGTIVSKSAV